MRSSARLILLLIGTLVGASPVSAAYVTFGSSAVTGIAESYPGNNLGALDFFPCGTIQNVSCGTTENPFPCRNRGLVKFDVAGQIPAGSRITGVAVFMSVTRQPPNDETDPNAEFALHRLLLPWGEGSGNNLSSGSLGRPAQDGESNWLFRQAPTNAWAMPGGAPGIDFLSERSGSGYITDNPNDGPFVISSFSKRFESDTQLWLDHPELNHGWLMKAGDENARWTAKRFRAAESNSLDDFPQLLVVYLLPPTLAASIPVLNPQSGLFLQTVTVVNVNDSAIDAVRVRVTGLTNGTQLFNASGQTNGVPFVLLNRSLGAGESASLTIEYYVPSRSFMVMPTLVAEIASLSAPLVVSGLAQPISRRTALPDGTFLIDFSTLSNRTYYVQYSADMMLWRTATPAVIGTGTTVQWIDVGPPNTSPPPQDEPARFYQVLLPP